MTTISIPDKNIFSPKEIAKILGTSNVFVIGQIRNHSLNGIQIGSNKTKRFRVSREDLISYIDKRNV
jgi:hypothetical protein